MPPTRSDSPQVEGGYEIVNALGRLNADRPKLADRCVNVVNIARSIRLMLHALDLHMQQTGKTPEQIARDIRRGRIEMRFIGPRIVLAMKP